MVFKRMFRSKLNLISIISIIVTFNTGSFAKDALESSFFYISPEKEAYLKKHSKQIHGLITADLYEANHFKSEHGKAARKLLLKFADGESQVIDQGINLLNKGAEENDPHSIAWLGALHQIGAGSLDIDLKKSLTFFQKAAKLNDPFGLYNIGFFHEKGRYGLEKSRDIAFKYYDLSNDADGHWTLNRLGDSYRNGNEDLNIEVDKTYAVELYKQAVDKGSLNAKVALSQLYYAGDGTQLAADARLLLIGTYGKELCATGTVFGAKGCLFIARVEQEEMRILGVQSEKKRQRIINNSHRAYKQGNGLAEAYAFLALAHSGDPSFNASSEQITEWFELGCVDNTDYISFEIDTISMACTVASEAFAFGKMEWNAKRIDHGRAKRFINTAMSNNYSKAYTLLSLYYKVGTLFKKDELYAFQLVKKAAEEFDVAGSIEALAGYYARGEYVDKSLQKAHDLYRKAALKGNLRAMLKYSHSFIEDTVTGFELKKPDFENCFVWSSLANIRHKSLTAVKKYCGSKLTIEKKSH